ncbi:Toluene-4-sulfonate monooxygenase system reductase subunit TsaB1 [Vibrio thalassae]|uniref:Toluene-4-sulfonate monooxygenase system reductase subunit TsaB1 n=1 Tax=Vibrio thalassae TaxID=1243014 RepID=A0A240ELS6_9VIBR|nr:2Fe-2S iron-sulfur cluster-binding protein [Vibrio thalassae]SNX49652.1 Toluene-4-sulfonate monooxygenase system reductase subunit TsaB1 [Vibrio thalassae]
MALKKQVIANEMLNIFICQNKKIKNGSKSGCGYILNPDIVLYLKSRLKNEDISNVKVSQTDCLGRCSNGPNIAIFPTNEWYHFSNKGDVDELINQLSITTSEDTEKKKSESTQSPFSIYLKLSEKTFSVGSETSILSVLLENGYEIPYSCKQGLCGKCQVKICLPEGEEDPLAFTPSPEKWIKTCIYRTGKNKTVDILL